MTHTEDITKRVPSPRPRKPAGSDCYSAAVRAALQRANAAHLAYFDSLGADDDVRNAAFMEYVYALEQLHTAIFKDVNP